MSKSLQSPDFQVAVPEGWRYRSVTTLLEPPGAPGQFQRSIVITQDYVGEPCTAEELATRQRDDMLAVLPGFEPEEIAPLGLRGAPIPQLKFHWNPPTTAPITQRQAFFVRAPWAWTITGTTRRDD